MTAVRRSPLLALVPCLLLGLLTGTAAAHDGRHLSEPVSLGTRTVDGERVRLAYHSDAVSDVPDVEVVGAVARADLAAVPDTELGTAAGGLDEEWCGDVPGTLAAGTGTSDDVEHQVHPPSAPQFKVVYAYAADQASRFDQLADRLQANVSLLSRFMARQSGDTKTLRFDMGTQCGPEYADLQVVRLPRALAAYAGPNFRLLADDVVAITGSQAGPRDWLVYADGMRQGGVAGTGSFYYGAGAEAPGTTIHDAGRLVSVVWGPSTLPAGPYADPTTMLHEMGHNLGAVQGGAPHTTGLSDGLVAGHCTDEWDVMCYADGGSDNVLTYPCDQLSGAVVEAFDCNGDDYFNPAPAAGSWLAAHWNLYASAMLGDCATELTVACDAVDPPSPAPLNTTPAAPTGWVAAPYAVTLTGTHATRFEWRVDGGTARATATATLSTAGQHALETRVGSAAAWTSWRSETVRVDAAAPVVTLGCFRVLGLDFACTASGEDAESGLVDLEISNGSDSLSIVSGETVYARGPATITATGRDAVGHVGRATQVIDVPASAPTPPGTGTAPPGPGVTDPAVRTVPVRVRDRRGRTLGRASLTVTAAGEDRTARLALGRVRVPAGAYRVTTCLRESGRKPRCRSTTARLRRAGRLPKLAVSAALGNGTVRGTVTIARKRAGRYGKPVATARAAVA